MSQQSAGLAAAPLTVDDVHAQVARLFLPDPVERVGLELETLVGDVRDGSRPTLDRLPEARRLPRGSALTWEPGGQLEVSTAPRPRLDRARADLGTDLAHARHLLEVRGLRTLPGAIDPRPHARLLAHPRYDAMEASFDAVGPHGRTMMARTASVQVNVNNGADPERRFRILHRAAPLLAALVADSPGEADEGSWVSLRQRAWLGLDPARVLFEPGARPVSAAYADFALDADVFVVRRGTGVGETWHRIPRGLSLRRWIAEGHCDLGSPSVADLDYHLTTLFPPVRPRGWFEVRVLDRTDRLHCDVAAALVLALVHASTIDAVEAALDSLGRGVGEATWALAARHGLGSPVVAAGAARVLDAAMPALPRITADTGLIAAAHDLRRERVIAPIAATPAKGRQRSRRGVGAEDSLEALQEPPEQVRELAAL